MKIFSKVLGIFINLANYVAGIVTLLTLILKLDFTSIFYVNGMSTYESLFFNFILFSAGLALTGIVLSLFVNEYKQNDTVIEFPIFYEIIPVIISAAFVYFAFQGETVREKIAVIAGAVLYAVLSAVTVYCGSRMFQIFPKEK